MTKKFVSYEYRSGCKDKMVRRLSGKSLQGLGMREVNNSRRHAEVAASSRRDVDATETALHATT
jgi:hypothetical protein